MTTQSRLDKGIYWNPWSLVEGCTAVDESCAHCWSAAATHMRGHQQGAIGARYGGLTNGGPRFNGIVRPQWDDLEKPRHVRTPTTWAIWNDLFHADVPNFFIQRAFEVMATCRRHRFLILTKRPEWLLVDNDMEWTMRSWLPVLKHVWFGTTCGTQAWADKRIPQLMAAKVAHRYLSLEPLLGPVDLTYRGLGVQCPDCDGTSELERGHPDHGANTGDGDDADDCLTCWRGGYEQIVAGIDWVIVGCESGDKRRPCEIEWVESVVEQCRDSNVLVFVKQVDVGGRVSKNMAEWPESIRVRQLPWLAEVAGESQ